MKDEDDSGDEAEARHLLAKRREQAKYDAVRGDSDQSVVEKAAEPGLMDSLLRCLITPPQPVDRRRSTMAAAGVPDRMVEPSPYGMTYGEATAAAGTMAMTRSRSGRYKSTGEQLAPPTVELEFSGDDEDESPEWAVPEHKPDTGAPEDEVPPPPAPSTTTTAADSPEVEHTMASLARALEL
jgi:hypothetical protein